MLRPKTHRGSGASVGMRSLRLNRAEAFLLWFAIEIGLNKIFDNQKNNPDQLTKLRGVCNKYRNTFNIKG